MSIKLIKTNNFLELRLFGMPKCLRFDIDEVVCPNKINK
jgi:hypothetical protein